MTGVASASRGDATRKLDWSFADHDAYVQNREEEGIWRNSASDWQQNTSGMNGGVKSSDAMKKRENRPGFMAASGDVCGVRDRGDRLHWNAT